MTLASSLRQPVVSADLDTESDVFYLVLGTPRPIEGDGRPRGVEINFDLKTGSPCGVTVIGFERNGWRETLDELATIASAHLALPGDVVERAIAAALETASP